MTIYSIAPSPSLGLTEHDFVSWRDGFISIDLDRIIEIGDSLEQQDSKIDGNLTPDEKIRKCKVAWLKPDQEGYWVYDKLSWILRQLNAQFYRFNITGFDEFMQYTVYDGDESSGGHYRWHRDASSSSTSAPRKLSMVIQLSDPEEYEGGVLEIMGPDGTPIQVDKQKGFVVMFPSYALHRVTPVTKGTRKSLVAWASGPAFV